MSKVNIAEIDEQLNKLIEKGTIKSVYEIEEIPIHYIPKITGLCVKDLVCYFCQKHNNDTNCDKCSR